MEATFLWCGHLHVGNQEPHHALSEVSPAFPPLRLAGSWRACLWLSDVFLQSNSFLFLCVWVWVCASLFLSVLSLFHSFYFSVFCLFVSVCICCISLSSALGHDSCRGMAPSPLKVSLSFCLLFVYISIRVSRCFLYKWVQLRACVREYLRAWCGSWLPHM